MGTVEEQVVPELARRLREAELTTEEIARACGVTRREAQNWLAGRIAEPHPRNRRRVERLLRARGADTNGGTL